MSSKDNGFLGREDQRKRLFGRGKRKIQQEGGTTIWKYANRVV